MIEIWKIIDGYNGKYVVSNLGNVKSLARCVSNHTGFINKPERVLKHTEDIKGYLRVSLDKDGKTKFVPVHRLVALAFIPNPLNKPQVNHIDGNKHNNRVDNLEWVTNQENCLHAVRKGLNDHSKYHAGRPCKPVLQIDIKTGVIVAEYPSIASAKETVAAKSKTNNIGACCRGERNKAFGFKWRFRDE